MQFKHTYRRLILGIINNIVHNANALIQDNSEILAHVPSVQDKINYICDIYNFDDVTVDDIKNVTFTEYKTNVVEYVSGFVVKQILRKLNCNLCVSFVKINQPESIDTLAYELTKQVISCNTCICMKHSAKFQNENLKKQITFKADETYFTK